VALCVFSAIKSQQTVPDPCYLAKATTSDPLGWALSSEVMPTGTARATFIALADF